MNRANYTRVGARAACALGVAAAMLGCASNNTSNRASGTHGVVPADVRDVERDAEGLVVTTFGDYPARMPDWNRAASILSLLDQVWARAKSGNPRLPSDSRDAVDTALSDAGMAVSAMDQENAAYAANAIGLAMPVLFDFFHPDVPLGVTRMDAMFRQAGLDGHFGRTDAIPSDLDSLGTDWGNTRAAVDGRVPTCHRVGGTATVSDDIDQSLAVMQQASVALDAGGVEHESENGATEVDTLELLFDCPPDNVTPTHGLGSACQGNSECESGQVCDTANAGGRCAPDPGNTNVGKPCTSTIDCGSDPRAACNTEAGDNYPGGYCTMEPCDDIQLCPPGGTCVALGGETPSCFQACSTDADCRTSEGYVCQLFVTAPPVGFGPSDHACAFACTRDSDCQAPLTCVVSSGKCTP